MTTTINADNGVSSGSAGLKSSADSSGVLALQTNGTTAVTIDTSQRVGVAQASPAYTLDVNGTMRLGSAGTIQPLLLRSTVTGGLIVNTAASGGAGPLVVQDNGTEVFRVTDSLVVLKGGSTSATGVGITFPATQSASTDANTLDDYEEGTWTPTDGSGAGLSFTVPNAVYIKIGQMVYVATRITFPTTASSANIQINGLPFTSPSVTGGYWGGGFRYTDYTVFFVVGVSPSSSVFQFYNLNNLGVTNAQASGKTFDLVFMFRATA